MRLKDILELGTYDLNPEARVEIFDMENFEEAIENNQFSQVYIPNNEDCEIYQYAFLVDDTILIAMED